MNWLLIAIFAHSISAVVFVIDKYILSRTRLRPAAYAFYVGIFGGLALFLIPFGFNLLPVNQVIISFSAGAFFVLAVLFFYKSIQIGEVSRITPIIGGAVPIFTLILSYLFLSERLGSQQLIAFSLFVLGGMVMLWPRKGKRIPGQQPLIKRLPIVLLAALFFSGSFVLTKYIFSYQPFINGFIWIRLGGVLGAGLLFLLPISRRVILDSSRRTKARTGVLVVLSKGLSAGGFILLNYAIFLGSVSLVNALQGIQYVFLLVLGVFLSRKFPQIIKEQISEGALIQKIVAIILIGLGLIILAFQNGVF